MSGFIAFVLMLSGMGVGTLICGLLPLSLPLSHRMMRVLEVFGAGLLVGAAVTVVIPEGSSALFERVTPQASAASASVYSQVLHPASAFRPVAPHTQSHADTPTLQALQTGGDSAQQPWAWSFITKRSAALSASEDDHHHDAPNKDEKPFTHSDAEHRLGSSILFGIILMFVIDQITSGSAGHKHDDSSLPGGHHHHHSHHNEYAAPSQPPVRPRLETHRLSKSFHQKSEHKPASSKPLHKVSSKASFTVFDRSQHGIPEHDEEAHIGGNTANAIGSQDAGIARTDPHRRIESVATSSSSDNDLPDDYDDHGAAHYQNADLTRVSSNHAPSEWHNSPRSSATLHREDSNAPLLNRQNSFTSVNSGRPRASRTRSASSIHTGHSTFGQALTTIVGLLIHATADGIAMGASAQSGDQTLTMVVFVAIMIHKAPAAFGLCAMLMSQRLSRTSIRKAVAIFSLAAPLGAILTYLALAAFFDVDIVSADGGHGHGQQGQPGIDGKSVGTALAFSGGTFLFVAFHAVLELAGVDADTVPCGGEDGGEVQILGKWLRVILLIAGACTPRALQSVLSSFGAGGHGH